MLNRISRFMLERDSVDRCKRISSYESPHQGGNSQLVNYVGTVLTQNFPVPGRCVLYLNVSPGTFSLPNIYNKHRELNKFR
jgi:hypothetical protein